jgi:hypothetical protein
VFHARVEGVEQAAEFVDGEFDQSGWCWAVFAFGGGGHDQKGVDQHCENGPAMPGGPAAHLVLVQAGETFGCLERFFDASALPGDADQGGQRHGFRAVAAQVGQFPGGGVAADQHVVLAGFGVVFGLDGDPGQA